MQSHLKSTFPSRRLRKSLAPVGRTAQNRTMFTGLVESTGKVISLEEKGEQARLTLAIPFASELALGDSVAISGCCLTVADLGEHVAFDLLAQTLKVTSLGQLRTDRLVNLERAVGDRLGGHFVQGHVNPLSPLIRSPFLDHFEC